MDAKVMIRGWVALVTLSALTTLLTLPRTSGTTRLVAGALVLVFAGLKARVILRRYLGLSASAFWSRAFDIVIFLFLLLAYGVYLLGGLA